MKKILLIFVILVVTLACQTLKPARDGLVISNCSELVGAVRSLQSIELPDYLYKTGIKTGGEFDVNQYFAALPHLSMQTGYVLDYIYSADDLGGDPTLYVRPENHAPYTSIEDISQNDSLQDYHNYLVVDDVERGYFEEVALSIMDDQFYQFWHAAYNDTEIVCDQAAVEDIIKEVNDGDFGYSFDDSQQTEARSIQGVEPLVKLTEDTAVVEVVTFTRWGGFYRQTYTISRSFPHQILDVQGDELVLYDCGVEF